MDYYLILSQANISVMIVKLGDIVICGSSELKRLKEGTKRWFFTCKKMKILIDYEK